LRNTPSVRADLPRPTIAPDSINQVYFPRGDSV